MGAGLILFETYRRSKQETSKREDVADQIEKLENQVSLFRKAFVDLEKETLKNNGTGLSATRRILPKELYELEEEDEKESKPSGWRSWFQVIYRRDAQEKETEPKPSIDPPRTSPQSRSSEQTDTTKEGSKSSSILGKILPTTHKNEDAKNSQQAGLPNRTSTGTNDASKQGG